jgi:hypothetical protein
VEGPQICESWEVKLHRFKNLALPKATEFEFELERNIENTYPNYDYRPQNYGSTTNSSEHCSAFNFAFNHQLHTVQARPGPRKIDKSDIQVLDRELGKNFQGPLKSFVIATKPEHVVKVLLYLKHRLRPDSTILFAQRVVGLMEDVNKAVFPDPSNRPNYLLGLPYQSAVKTPFLFPIPQLPISLARGMSRLRTPSWLLLQREICC